MKRKKQTWIILVLLLSFLLCACQQEQKSTEEPKEKNEGKQGTILMKEKQKVEKQKDKSKEDEQKEAQKLESSLEKLREDAQLVFDDPAIEAFEFKEYKTSDGTAQNMMVVKVPNINIKSEDVSYFNKQMNAFAKYSIQRYQKITDAQQYWDYNTEYRVYQKDDLLSVIVFSYYPYEVEFENVDDYRLIGMSSINIDLKTGKRIEDEDLLKRFHIENMEEALMASVHDTFKKDDLKFEDEMDYITLEVAKNSISGSLYKIWSEFYEIPVPERKYVPDESLENVDTTYWAIYKLMYDPYPPVLYYSEKEDALMANTMVFVPAEAGYFFSSKDLSKFKYKKPEINPSYEYYAKKLGIDPNAADAPLAFSGFIGYKNDEDAGFRLQSAVVYADVELEKLSKQVSLRYKDGITSTGDELYLIIPKHNEVVLAFSTVMMDENMQEEKFEPSFTSGNTFVVCNVGDMFSDYEIVVMHRGQYSVYRPHLSLKDASNVVVEGVMDITEILREEIPLKSTPSDEFLSQYRPKG